MRHRLEIMVENKEYLLSNYDFLDQMHDETIDKISIDDNKLELTFNSLHFLHGKQYKSAKIIFSDFEDVTTDVHIDMFVKEGCNIKSGCFKYINEFIPYMKNKKIKLEVISILSGYEEIVIKGEFINENGSYGEHFLLSISAKKISYIFIG